MSDTNKKSYLDATGLTQVWAAIIANFVKQEAGKGLSTNDLTDALLAKLNGIAEGAQVNVIESVKVNGTALEITEKAVNVLVPTGALASLDKVGKDQLDDELATLINNLSTDVAKKADKATTLAGYGIADAYTKTETYSKDEADTAISDAVSTAIAGVYKVKGSVAFASLPALASSDLKEGFVYNVTDAFTTTADFVEGAGVAYPAGSNVVAVKVGEALKWDVMAGTYDFSEYLTKDDVRSLTSEEIAAICVIS